MKSLGYPHHDPLRNAHQQLDLPRFLVLGFSLQFLCQHHLRPSSSHQHLYMTCLLQYTSPIMLSIGAIAMICYVERPFSELGLPRLDTEAVRKWSRLRLQDVVSSRNRAGYLGLGRATQHKGD